MGILWNLLHSKKMVKESCFNCKYFRQYGGFFDLPECECLKEEEVTDEEFCDVFQSARDWNMGEKPLCHCYEKCIEEEE